MNLSVKLLLTVSLLALPGCNILSQPEAPPAKTHTVAKRTVAADDYVLALAQLRLAQWKNEDASAQRPYAKILSVYADNNKKAKKPQRLTLLSLEYAIPAGGKRVLLIPVTASASQADAASLQKLAPALSRLPGALQNIHAWRVNFPAEKTPAFSNEENWPQHAEEAHSLLFGSATPLTGFENARLQLVVAKVSLQKRLRDPAYMAIENAKQAVALLVETAPEKADALSKEVAVLEESLHRDMPYEL